MQHHLLELSTPFSGDERPIIGDERPFIGVARPFSVVASPFFGVGFGISSRLIPPPLMTASLSRAAIRIGRLKIRIG